MRKWWQLTWDEVERYNPPPLIHTTADDGNYYIQELFDDRWLPVGHIPKPRTRLGWFMYHLIHGLVMRYPWWKVIAFAVICSRPSEGYVTITLNDDPELAEHMQRLFAKHGIELTPLDDLSELPYEEDEAAPVDVGGNLL